jgi:putative FmdB family regulatory protein
MPIYAYKCEACGHAQDVLRKISDPPLDICPQCGASAFVKQVTAAGFQLKGSGWYVTDFRGGNNAPAKDGAKDAAKEAPANDAPATGSASTESGSSSTSASTASDAKPSSGTAAASAPAAAGSGAA